MFQPATSSSSSNVPPPSVPKNTTGQSESLNNRPFSIGNCNFNGGVIGKVTLNRYASNVQGSSALRSEHYDITSMAHDPNHQPTIEEKQVLDSFNVTFK